MDHGAKENLRRYGSPRPPDYPLRNVTAPVALYGVIKLSKVLPNVVSLHIIKEKFFNHMDFFYSTNMEKLLMNHVLDIMQRF
ncbi:Lipase [Gryllus bimaculatus]|nr:Lipase [Gryllus bimaculatus]